MANEYLKRTPTSNGNRKVWTFSCWAKISGVTSTDLVLFGAYRTGTSQGDDIFFRTGPGGALRFTTYNGSSYEADILDNAYKRDSASWMHVMGVANTPAGTGTDKWHLYVNGVRITDTSTNTYPSANLETNINNLVQHYIGAPTGGDAGQITDLFFVDGQALTPDVFGYYKKGDGYISAGSTQATDFKRGQWVPKAPKVIKSVINARGGFGVNGFYLPMNEGTNVGADLHCAPNSIIKLKGEDEPQPYYGAPTTTDAYVSQLREDPYKDYLVLAMPLISGGKESGLGDYSADIKGSGTNKVVKVTGFPTVSGISSSLFYGSALVDYNNINNYLTVIQTGNDFRLDPEQEDWTIEFWTNPYTRSAPRHTALLTKGSATANNSHDWRFYVGQDTSIDYDINFGIGGDSGDETGDSFALSSDQWSHIAVEAHNGILTKYVNGVAVGVNTSPRAQTTNHNTIQISRGDIGGAGDVGYVGAINDIRIYSGVAKYKGGFDVPKPYTPVGIATWRAVPDTTANNFATLNGVVNSLNGSNESFSNGNLTVSNTEFYESTIGITTGKWYWEYYEDSYSDYGTYNVTGLVGSATTFADRGQVPNIPHGGTIWYAPGRSNGAIVVRGTTYNSYDLINMTHPTETLPLTSAGNVYAIALDLDSAQGIGSTGGVYFYINGVGIDQNPQPLPDIYQGISTTGNVVAPGVYASGTQTINFGQNPTFSGNTTAGTYTDSNGKGLFKYEPPSGFLALCEDNLPTPAIADPGDYFKTVLWTGDGNVSREITGVGFAPDFVWLKSRTSTNNHQLLDSVRGWCNLNSNNTNTEGTNPAINGSSDGFSHLNGSSNNFNGSGRNYVAWCWQAGAGTTSTNTDGSINSVVSVNQDAGFSIVSYTGNNTDAATVGHGLGKTPALLITKSRDNTQNPAWHTSHVSLEANYDLALDSNTAAWNPSSNGWHELTNSSVFTLQNGSTDGNNVNRNGDNYIAYCWAEIEGFSKFGSYVGNGNADGPFVYCGFKPAWVLIKQTNGTGDWYIFDCSRNSTNPVTLGLISNSSQTDADYTGWGDFLSNGFKIRRTDSAWNGSGNTYVFAAFAESPFTTANAK